MKYVCLKWHHHIICDSKQESRAFQSLCQNGDWQTLHEIREIVRDLITIRAIEKAIVVSNPRLKFVPQYQSMFGFLQRNANALAKKLCNYRLQSISKSCAIDLLKIPGYFMGELRKKVSRAVLECSIDNDDRETWLTITTMCDDDPPQYHAMMQLIRWRHAINIFREYFARHNEKLRGKEYLKMKYFCRGSEFYNATKEEWRSAVAEAARLDSYDSNTDESDSREFLAW